jgi:DUF4097 and DUF4098 domain-containing protein YvlB
MSRESCLAAFAALTLVTTPALAQDRGGDAQQQPPIQARPGGPETAPRTDQTVDVTKGTRLVLSNNAGEVIVRSWDRDQVRVQATHGPQLNVDVATADNTLRVRARATRGPANLIDYQITVPRWMAVNLSGTYLESTIEGTTAEVTVETVHGNIRVVGGSGNVNLRSVEGIITVEKAAGKLQATTINEGIRLTNISGDVTADTTNGDIFIENAQTTSLDVSTVNGDVTFNGTMRDGGAYRLTTHGGDLRVGLGGAPNATVFVRTFQGDFTADFPIQLPDGQSAREGSKRFNFTLGSGSARIELQSFNGDIIVARKTIMSAEEARRIRRGETPRAQPPQPPQPPQQPQPKPKPPKGELAHDFAFDHDFKVDHDFNFNHNFNFNQNFTFEHALDFAHDVDFDLDLQDVFDFEYAEEYFAAHDFDFDFDSHAPEVDVNFDFGDFTHDFAVPPAPPAPPVLTTPASPPAPPAPPRPPVLPRRPGL